MPRAHGFARGDLDTSFPLDDKFLALRGSVTPERYYAAAGVYFHVAAATWREAERKPAIKVCPDAAQEVADLRSVGLLDDDGCVTKRAFANTVGRARRARRVATDRKARNRAGKSRGTDRDVPATDEESQSSRAFLPLLGTVTDPDTGGAGGPQEPPPPLTTAIDYIEQRSGRSWSYRPESKTWDTLDADVRDFGAERVIAAMRELPIERPDIPQLVFGASRVLHPIAAPRAKRGHEGDIEEVERAFG